MSDILDHSGLPADDLLAAEYALGVLNRLASLEKATDQDLENGSELIRIRDEFKASPKDKTSKDAALDDLQVAGYSMVNPLGPSTLNSGVRQPSR